MRILFAMAIALGITSLSPTFAPASAEPPRFGVPRITPDAAPTPDAVPVHEVVLPADVVVRPGESPSEAIARALHPERGEPSRESK